MKRNLFRGFLLAGCSLAAVNEAEAVAFKCHNQTDLKFRMRVHDRGNWRPPVEMPPTYWECPARGVERKNHAVEIDVWTAKEGREQWVPFYRGTHGSHTFTRIVHLFRDNSGNVVMAWHDEPPGCRDKPVWNGQGVSNGCLIASGWQERLLGNLLRQAAKVIAGTAIRAIFLGG
jgi:hypothetical protein